MKIISVIIPCYNVEKTIDRCLTSIINQTIGVDNLEIICVDDCSTDNTLNILKKWEVRYPNDILLVESPQNGRQGQARNIGLSYASCDWIGFIDSDDWIENIYFEILHRVAISHSYDVVCCDHIRDASDDLSYCNTQTVDEILQLNNIQNAIDISNTDARKKLIINPVTKYSAWAKIIKKSVLIENNIYFPENLTYEDIFWGSLLTLYIKNACLLNIKLYHYYVNTASTILTNNSFHHFDHITVNVLLWNEWKTRGLYSSYKQELEMESIYSGYLAGIKMLILRFQTPNYNGYLLLRQLILLEMPEIMDNQYLKENILPDKLNLALTALRHQLNKQQFMEFAEHLKKIGL